MGGVSMPHVTFGGSILTGSAANSGVLTGGDGGGFAASGQPLAAMGGPNQVLPAFETQPPRPGPAGARAARERRAEGAGAGARGACRARPSGRSLRSRPPRIRIRHPSEAARRRLGGGNLGAASRQHLGAITSLRGRVNVDAGRRCGSSTACISFSCPQGGPRRQRQAASSSGVGAAHRPKVVARPSPRRTRCGWTTCVIARRRGTATPSARISW